MKIRSHLLAAVSLAVITFNLLLWLIPLVLLAGIKLIGLGTVVRADPVMDAIYRAAVRVDDAWLRGVLGIRWSRPELGLARDRSYVLIANHRSWADIFPIQSVVVGEGPLVKFLTKRELVYLPILGTIFWAFDFPLLRRAGSSDRVGEASRRADIETLRAACEVMRDRPAALMNFAEGTRFTAEKHAASQSPFRHLLRPRAGGLLAVIEALDEHVEAIVDLTLIYPGDAASFWRFLAGAVPTIDVQAERIPIGAIPRDREGLDEWLSQRWAEKDSRIERARRQRAEAPAAS